MSNSISQTKGFQNGKIMIFATLKPTGSRKTRANSSFYVLLVDFSMDSPSFSVYHWPMIPV